MLSSLFTILDYLSNGKYSTIFNFTYIYIYALYIYIFCFIAGSWITSFYSILFCYNFNERIKLIPSQGRFCVEFESFPHICVWVFLRDSGFFTHPKDVHIKYTGISKFFQCEWTWVWVWVHLWWKGILSRGGTRLVPWAAWKGSGHPWP